MSPSPQRAQIENIPSGAVILDSNGLILGYGDAWLDFATAVGFSTEPEPLGTKYGDTAEFYGRIPELDKHIASVLNGESEEFSTHFTYGEGSDQKVVEIIVARWEEGDTNVVVHHQERQLIGRNIGKWVNEDFFQTLFEKLSTGIIFQSASGEIEFVNAAAAKALDLPYQSFLNTEELQRCWHTVDGVGDELAWNDFPGLLALRSGVARHGVVMGVDSSEGERRWIRVDSELICHKKSNSLLGVLSSFSDITLERKVQSEIAKVTERLQLALEGAQIGIWDWDIDENKMVWDDGMYRLYGYEGRKHIPVSEVWARAVHPKDKKKVESALNNMRKGLDEERTDFKIILPYDRGYRYLRVQTRPVFDDKGRLYRIIGINWDVTRERESERRLKEMAFQDELTQLPNRVAFNYELNKIIAEGEKIEKKFVVLVMDLDNFKDINDNFGHPTGDSVLCEVVNRVQPLLDARCLFARLSGDEFGLLIPYCEGIEQCQALAENIQTELVEPFYLVNGLSINIKASMGLSCYPDDANDAVELTKNADLAMYKSKDKGRDCITWYDREMSIALKRKVTLENKLREAIRDEEFQLYYQPIVDLSTRNVIGCEALMRWIDKNGDFISPAEFIPVAEQSGLIYEMGAWINHTAFKQFKLWQVINTSLQYVSVNVSPHQLQYSRFLENLLDIVAATGIEPSKVQLEITEGTFLQESLNTGSHLNKLAAAGFHLAIDDFGTGYSSLSYLKRFNVDVIKIDKSFIDEIETDQADKDIVKAIMAMTSSLGFKTLVEGIERPEQAEIVKAFGCGYAQGYYYGRPLNADEFAETFIGLN